MATVQADVEIWDLTIGRRLGTLPLPKLSDGKVSPLTISTDHKTAYAAFPEGLAVLAWDPDRWTTLACARGRAA